MPGHPGTPYADQAVLKTTDIHLPLSWDCDTTALHLSFFVIVNPQSLTSATFGEFMDAMAPAFALGSSPHTEIRNCDLWPLLTRAFWSGISGGGDGSRLIIWERKPKSWQLLRGTISTPTPA